MIDSKEIMDRKRKFNIDRWIERALLRFREDRYMGFGESVHWHSDPDGFVLWMKDKFGSSPVTFRQYRKRFVDHAHKCGYVDAAEIIQQASVLKSRKKEISVSKVDKGVQANARKKRMDKLLQIQKSGSAGYEASMLGMSELTQFMATANENYQNGKRRYTDGQLIALIVRLGCMTGLRPIEWYGSYIAESIRTHYREEPYREVLVVRGAIKGQRANRQEDYRYLSIEHWKETEKAQLRELLVIMETMRDGIEQHLREMGNIGTDQSVTQPSGVINTNESTGRVEVYGVQQGVINSNQSIGGGVNEPIDLFSLGRASWARRIKLMVDGVATISLRVFGRKGVVTLYTGRHIYAGEFRRSRTGDKLDLAEALGHSDIVNQTYYSDSLSLDDERLFSWSLAIPLRVGRAPIQDRADQRRLRGKVALYRYFMKGGEEMPVNAIKLVEALPERELIELAKEETKKGVVNGAANRLILERGIEVTGGSKMLGTGAGQFDDLPIVDFDMDL